MTKTKKLFGAVLLLSVCFAGPASAIVSEGVVQQAGQSSRQGQGPLRQQTEGALVTGNVGGDYYEGARLGEVFTIKTASAGTSFTTAGTSPLAAAGTAWLALYNPNGSPVNLEIASVTINGISGTPGAGGQVYDIGCSQNITAAQNATPVSSLLPTSAGYGRGYTQTALTGSAALTELGMTCYAPFAAAMAATTAGLSCTDFIIGKIILAPGCVLAIQATAAGTTHLAAGSITYRQALP
jgi:hypothetical protein